MVDARKGKVSMMNIVAMWVSHCFPICMATAHLIATSSQLPRVLAKTGGNTWNRPTL